MMPAASRSAGGSPYQEVVRKSGRRRICPIDLPDLLDQKAQGGIDERVIELGAPYSWRQSQAADPAYGPARNGGERAYHALRQRTNVRLKGCAIHRVPALALVTPAASKATPPPDCAERLPTRDQVFAFSISSISAGTTWNRSPTMP